MNSVSSLRQKVRGLVRRFVSRYLTTFRRKAVSVAIPGLVLASVVYTVDAMRTEQAIMKNEIIKRAEVVAELASQIAVLPLISKNTALIQDAVTWLERVSEVSHVAFYNTGMKSVTALKDFPGGLHQLPTRPQMTIFENDDFFDVYAPVYEEKTKEDIGLFVEQDVKDESKELVGWVRIAFSKSQMKAARVKIIVRGLIIAVIFTLGSSFVVYRLFFLATRPLTVLSVAAQSVRNGKYPEVSVNSEDEIGRLAGEFNRMSTAINEREEMLVRRMRIAQLSADMGIVFTGGEPLPKMMKRCAEVLNSHAMAELVILWLYDKDARAISQYACAGRLMVRECPGMPLLPEGTGAKLIAREKRAIVTTDAANDERFLGLEWLKENEIRFYAGYPLIVESQLIGVLEIFSQKTLDETLVNALGPLSDQIAVGLERKIIEGQIMNSLSEKELLLREVHHRVKNNMQVISSLLSLQSEKAGEQKYIEMFNDSKDRIRSMSLVHEKLYRSADLDRIDIKDYIGSLAKALFDSHSVSTGRISLTTDIENIALDIDTAIPFGLILNELISNSLKHAFPEGREGEIRISVRRTTVNGAAECILSVRDNGIGIPADLDIQKVRSLGLQLVTSLAEHQLQGQIELDRTTGTVFRIRFRESVHRKR
ncbi:MAG: HAMP domain-containing protein [Nitrospirae bacterium]|nr:HAMP domain-containing protein [Nitrospirota bacterium]